MGALFDILTTLAILNETLMLAADCNSAAGILKIAHWLALGLCATVGGTGASAAELSRDQLSNSADIAHCSVYGPGYVRVGDTYACARIGERMRVQMRVTRAPPFLGGFAPQDDSLVDGANRAYLRLDGPGRGAGRTLER